MAAQINQVMDNIETVLGAAGFKMSDVVRMTYYTTNIDLMLANWGVLVGRLMAANCRPASSLLGVTRLAFPENLIEIEVTAVK